jgi:hypothetical protein
MTISEISKEFGLSKSKSEQIKVRVSEVFLLSDLVSFQRMSMRLVQMLYDFGFKKLTNLELASFTGTELR